RRRPRDEARRARTGVYRSHNIEAAEQEFAERGFAAAKLQDISRLACLSMGTIYALFPGETALARHHLVERGRDVPALARHVAWRFAALDQVLLADWVASGMKADRDALVRRLRGQVERSFRRARRAARAPHHTATFISA